MTGDGVVLPAEEAVEVDRLSRAFASEMQAGGEAGRTLARRMATLAVRMDRCVRAESAALDRRVRAAMDEFRPPEGVDGEEAGRLREQAGRVALFDPSKEACLARKYEAEAERGFFRSLKELRQRRKEADADPAADQMAEDRAALARLGSFLQAGPADRPAPIPAPPTPPPAPSKPLPPPTKASLATSDPLGLSFSDIPITIGRRR